MDKIKSIEFYQAWKDTVSARKEHLLHIWRNSHVFTNYIKGNENSIVDEVADRLNLLCYPHDYYSLDTIFYLPEDKTPNTIPKFWFRDIRVAFEHENNFRGGLYQEVSHLLITHCDLRVLVSYPNEDTTNELKYLHEIISGSRQARLISDEESFLLIFGYEANFEWEGLVYKKNIWKRI